MSKNVKASPTITIRCQRCAAKPGQKCAPINWNGTEWIRGKAVPLHQDRVPSVWSAANS